MYISQQLMKLFDVVTDAEIRLVQPGEITCVVQKKPRPGPPGMEQSPIGPPKEIRVTFDSRSLLNAEPVPMRAWRFPLWHRNLGSLGMPVFSATKTTEMVTGRSRGATELSTATSGIAFLPPIPQPMRCNAEQARCKIASKKNTAVRPEKGFLTAVFALEFRCEK